MLLLVLLLPQPILPKPAGRLLLLLAALSEQKAGLLLKKASPKPVTGLLHKAALRKPTAGMLLAFAPSVALLAFAPSVALLAFDMARFVQQ